MADAPRRREGTLIIIGGHEDREVGGQRKILREVARRVRGGKLVLATIASHQPEGYFDSYEQAFADIHEGPLEELYIQDRAEAADVGKLKVIDDAAGIFFSGGDQLRLTDQISDTGIEAKVRDLYHRGGLIAGTSAGAAAMSDTMLAKGSSGESYKIGGLHLARGLGLIRGVIIDQHFAERGRFGRLLGAVAHDRSVLGVGIDEDTAVIAEGGRLTVIGVGAVYVVDGQDVTHCNVSEAAEGTLSMHNVRVHVLSDGDAFDLQSRTPVCAAHQSA